MTLESVFVRVTNIHLTSFGILSRSAGFCYLTKLHAEQCYVAL